MHICSTHVSVCLSACSNLEKARGARCQSLAHLHKLIYSVKPAASTDGRDKGRRRERKRDRESVKEGLEQMQTCRHELAVFFPHSSRHLFNNFLLSSSFLKIFLHDIYTDTQQQNFIHLQFKLLIRGQNMPILYCVVHICYFLCP